MKKIKFPTPAAKEWFRENRHLEPSEIVNRCPQVRLLLAIAAAVLPRREIMRAHLAFLHTRFRDVPDELHPRAALRVMYAWTTRTAGKRDLRDARRAVGKLTTTAERAIRRNRLAGEAEAPYKRAVDDLRRTSLAIRCALRDAPAWWVVAPEEDPGVAYAVRLVLCADGLKTRLAAALALGL